MDLQHLRASDGTGEAVLAHIQTVRNPGSTVLDLDNVDNWNTKAVIITGTPAANGFVSPVGMKVMYGHITAGDFIIDGYAPGYVDNGNTTAEVAIVKMTTSWADTLITLLGNSLGDDGFLKVTSLDKFFKPPELIGNFISSGGIIALSAGLIGTFSNIVYYISGLRYTKTAVANKTYTASKDTYVDINAAGTITYVEVANGATTGMTLTAGSVRVAKVVTSGAAITSVVQLGLDPLFNSIYPNGPVSPAQINTNALYSDSYNATGQAAAGEFSSPTRKTFDVSSIPTGHLFFVYARNYAGDGAGQRNVNVSCNYNGNAYGQDIMSQYHQGATVSQVYTKLAGVNSCTVQMGGSAASQGWNATLQQLN